MLDKSYRVYQASEKTKYILRNHREMTGESNELALATAVDQQLPRIVSALTELGFGKDEGPRGPVRWPVSDLVLAELKVASEQTGLPQSQLLLLSLLAHCKGEALGGTSVVLPAAKAPAPAPAKKRAGRAKKEAATTTSKKAAPAKPATRRGRKAAGAAK